MRKKNRIREQISNPSLPNYKTIHLTFARSFLRFLKPWTKTFSLQRIMVRKKRRRKEKERKRKKKEKSKKKKTDPKGRSIRRIARGEMRSGRFRLDEWNWPGNRWLLISVWRSISQVHRLKIRRLKAPPITGSRGFPPTTTRLQRWSVVQQATRTIIILLSSKRG